MYKRRIAYLAKADNLLTFGGCMTYAYSLIDICKKMNVLVDIIVDETPTDRKRYIPPSRFSIFNEVCHTTPIKMHRTASRATKTMPIRGAIVINSFLNAIENKLYDAILLNDVELLYFLAASFPDRLPDNVWLYMHNHEFFMTAKNDYLAPDWFRDTLTMTIKNINFAGMLIQGEANVPLVVKNFPGKVVKVVKVTLPDSKKDYSDFAKREGIIYFGSGEPHKNPELAIEIFNKVNKRQKISVDFVIGRGTRRLLECLKKAQFSYIIREKLDYGEVEKLFQTKKLGIVTSGIEGFCMTVVEQLYYYPVMLPAYTDYAKHFPSAIKFNTVDGAVEEMLEILNCDETKWLSYCEHNSDWLDSFYDEEKIIAIYEELFAIKPRDTLTSKKLSKLQKDITYKDLLRQLNWKDIPPAFVTAQLWNVQRCHDKKDTYILAGGKGLL